MATIIDLDAARRRRSARAGSTFAFDLASPWTYLAAAAVADDFGEARWVPALGAEPADHAAVERAARALGVRFDWPETRTPTGVSAARAASFAAEHGRAREFALAAARLTWGWGQDLDDHGLIAEAAGIADLPLDAVLDASFDPRRDAQLIAAAPEGAPTLTAGVLTLDGPALAAASARGRPLGQPSRPLRRAR